MEHLVKRRQLLRFGPRALGRFRGFRIPAAFSRDVNEMRPQFLFSPPFKQIPRIGFQESDVKRIFTSKDAEKEEEKG